MDDISSLRFVGL